MSLGFLLYIIMGLAWVKLEHDTFDYEFEDCSRTDIFYCVAQQIVHYMRIMIAWPLYLVEDFIIYLDNTRVDDE